MAVTTKVISNLNDTLPEAPAGADNIKFQVDRNVTPPNISAYVRRANPALAAGSQFYGTVIYDGSNNPLRYLGADGNFHDYNGVPSGGGTDQILAKNSNNNYDLKWMSAPAAANGMPSGGLKNQIIRKNSSTDNDASWVYNFDKNIFEHYDDFIGNLSTSSSYGADFVYYVSGSGSTCSQAEAIGHPGIATITRGSSGQATISTMDKYISAGIGEITWECLIAIDKTPVGNSMVNSFIGRAGLFDVKSGTAVDSINFQVFSDTSNAAKWRGRVYNNSVGSFTDLANGYAPTANEWVHLKFVINAAADSVEFFVNGSSIGTIATAIPTTLLYDLFQIWFVSGGTSMVATTMSIDYKYTRANLNR